MGKKILSVLLVLMMIFSLCGCGFSAVKLSKDEKEDKQGFSSSEAVIQAYWQAFSDVRKSGFRECFPDPDDAKKGTANVEDMVDSSYGLAEKMQDSVVIDLDNITVDASTCDIQDVNSEIANCYDVEDAEICDVVVPLLQTIDGVEYNVEDEYDITTICIDGNWYIIDVTETDVRIVDGAQEEPDTAEPSLFPEDTEAPAETEAPLLPEEPTEAVSNPSTAITDYNKVNWGVSYPVDGFPEITISVTPAVDDYGNGVLIIGITNNYDAPVTFSGTAKAKDTSGNYVGESFLFFRSIGSGNTVIDKITCYDGAVPSGEITWEDIQIDNGSAAYIPWKMEWQISNDGEDTAVLNYSITLSESAAPGEIYGLILDKDGFVIDMFYDYLDTEGTQFDGELKCYRQGIVNLGVNDVALFLNPVK